MLLNELKGKDIVELIASGKEKLASVPGVDAGGGGGAVAIPSSGGGAAPLASEDKEEKKEEKKERKARISVLYSSNFGSEAGPRSEKSFLLDRILGEKNITQNRMKLHPLCSYLSSNFRSEEEEVCVFVF